MEVSGQLHAPAALHPRKEPLVSIGWELGRALEPVWTRWWREKFPAPDIRLVIYCWKKEKEYLFFLNLNHSVLKWFVIMNWSYGFCIFKWQFKSYVNIIKFVLKCKRIGVFFMVWTMTLLLSRWMQSASSHTITLRVILMLCSHLCLGLINVLFPSCFLTTVLYLFIISLVCYMPHPSHPPGFDHHNNIWVILFLVTQIENLVNSKL